MNFIIEYLADDLHKKQVNVKLSEKDMLSFTFKLLNTNIVLMITLLKLLNTH